MGRLIDADAEIARQNDIIACELEAMNEFKNHNSDSYVKYMHHSALGRIAQAKSKIKFLNLIRTAYDVDKVVEQLELFINDYEVNLIGDCKDGILSIVKEGAVKE